MFTFSRRNFDIDVSCDSWTFMRNIVRIQEQTNIFKTFKSEACIDGIDRFVLYLKFITQGQTVQLTEISLYKTFF